MINKVGWVKQIVTQQSQTLDYEISVKKKLIRIKIEAIIKNKNIPPGKKPNKPNPLNKYKIIVIGIKIIINKRSLLFIV